MISWALNHMLNKVGTIVQSTQKTVAQFRVKLTVEILPKAHGMGITNTLGGSVLATRRCPLRTNDRALILESAGANSSQALTAAAKKFDRGEQ